MNGNVTHSVVLANYNGARHLAEAINSVVEQDADLELILVDDHSTDDSLAIMRDLESSSPGRIRVSEHSKNMGQGAGFNTGCALARGQFVSFIDSDDVWMPGKLNHVEEAFARMPHAALHQHNLDILRVDQPTTNQVVDLMVLGDIAARWRRTRSAPEHLPRFAPTSGLSLPKHVLSKLMPCPDVRICADMWLTFGALAFGPISASHTSFAWYRVHDGNNYFGGSMDIWRFLSDELLPEMKDRWELHGYTDVLPPLLLRPKAPIRAGVGDRILDVSLRKVFARFGLLPRVE